TWLNSLMLCMTVLGVVWPLTVLAPSLVPSLPYDVHYYPIEILLVLFIYWIGFAGYHYTNKIDKQAVRSQDVVAPEEARTALAQLLELMEPETPYLRTGLNHNRLSATDWISAKRLL